jgi:hypothetical protein
VDVATEVLEDVVGAVDVARKKIRMSADVGRPVPRGDVAQT